MLRSFLLALTAVLAMSVLACDDEGDRQDSTPVASSTAASFVRPAEGFVYALLARGGFGDDPKDVYRIAVFDSESMADVASFDVRGPVGYPQPSIMLSHDRIYVNFGDRITSYALNGADARDVHLAQGYVHAFDVSPDGMLMAVTETTRDPCPTMAPGETSAQCEPFGDVTRIAFIDLSSGDILKEVPQRGLDNFVGFFASIYWWADGTAVSVHGSTNSETAGGVARITPEGEIRVSAIRDYHPERPDGRYMFTGERLAACNLSIDRIEAAIVDLSDDSVAAAIRDETRLVSDYIWSPDGSELLFATKEFRALAPPEAPEAPPICRDRIDGTEQWRVLHVDGSPQEASVEPFAIIDRWHGGTPMIFTCNGERVLDARYCITGGQQSPVTVTYGGTTIATTTDFNLLGELQ